MINFLGIYYIFTNITLILIFTSLLVIFPSIPSDDHGVITSEWLEFLLIIEVYIYICYLDVFPFSSFIVL